MPLVTQARSGIIPSPAGNTTEYHVEVGLTYASGLKNVVDQLKTNFGFDDDSTFPIGLRLAAYAKTPSGFGFGGGIGPCEFIRVRNDHDHHGYYYDNNHDRDDDQWSYVVPVFADLRYYFPGTSLIAPYFRAGVAYPISGGDHLGSGTPGPLVAAGANVWGHRYLSIGVELGYDDSKVRVKSGFFHGEEKVRSGEFTLSVYAAF